MLDALVVAVDVTVASQLLHIIGQRLSILRPNRFLPHSLSVRSLHASSSYLLLHRSFVVGVVEGVVEPVIVADVDLVDVAVDVCVVSHPVRLKFWSGSSRYAVTSLLSAATVSPHVCVGTRTTVCQISTEVFDAPENIFAARSVRDAFARRGKETLRPPSSVPSTTLREAHSYISFPKSPKHGSL